MWGQLGRLQQTQSTTDEDEDGSSGGEPSPNNFWSRLGQLAVDVAQDLAQPQDEDDDDEEEEYYEEGEGWDDDLGLEGTPSWEEQQEDANAADPRQQQHYQQDDDDQQQPYYYNEGGEEQYYQEGGEEEQQQYAYQQGEEQYQDGQQEQQAYESNDYDATDDVGQDGWGEEEEVDFALENADQQISETLAPPENQPLFGEEQQQEPGTNADEAWDLEDDDLFGEEEAAVENQASQQQFSGEDEGLDAPAVEEGAEPNEWDQDENLEFGDSHEPKQEETPAQEPQAVDETVPDPNTIASVGHPGNEWDQDGDIQVDDDGDAPYNQTQNESFDTAQDGEGGGAWDDDDGLAGLDGLAAADNTFDTAYPAADNTFDTTYHEAQADVTHQNDGSVTEEQTNTDAQPQETTAIQTNENDNEWGMDELNFSSHHETSDVVETKGDSEAEPKEPTMDIKAGNTVSFADTTDNTQGEETPQGDHDTDANAWGNDDFDFSSHHETTQEQPPDSAAPEEDAWGNDELNFSERDEEDVGVAAPSKSETEPEAVGTPAEPVVYGGVGEPSTPIEAPTEAEQTGVSDSGLGLSEIPQSHDESEKPSKGIDANGNGTSEQECSTDLKASVDAPDNNDAQEDAAREPTDAKPAQPTEEVAVPDDDAWNDLELNLDDEDELDRVGDSIENIELARQYAAQAFGHSDDGGDDSTVEYSNIGFVDNRESKQPGSDEASASELKFALPGRTPSRRATIRASNTSSAAISRKGSEDEDSEAMSEKLVGTSVMFADLKVQDKQDDEKQADESVTGTTITTGPSNAVSSTDAPAAVRPSTSEVSVMRDALSSVSDYSGDVPKPNFETQISMMTLKSMADSCPSRQRENDSDEDDERGYGPVVSHVPEIENGASATMPGVSDATMTTTLSTAVAAHSVGEDYKLDDDMDGTYYGGSTAGEGQSNENAWEEEDAISLGGLHDLSEKIVNFELSTESNPSAPKEIPMDQPILRDTAQQEAETLTPPMDSSMAILYADDNSVPSRDKDSDNEELYMPIISHVPKKLQEQELLGEKSTRTVNSMAVLADNNSQEEGKQDESTTQKENNDTENGWDDDGFLGDIDEGDTKDDNADENSSTGEANQVVVENTPANTPAEANSAGWKSGGSLAAVESADNSCPSRVHDSDEELYGSIVDQCPTMPPPLDQMSVAASSMAVVAKAEDLKNDDEELDGSDHGGSTIDGLGVSAWENDEDVEGLEAGNEAEEAGHAESSLNAPSSTKVQEGDDDANPESDRVVDLTPKIESKKVSRFSSNSLAVLAHSVALYEENDDEDLNESKFLPIVDFTPTLSQKQSAMTPSSTAVQAARQDETTEGGVGDVNWDEECPPELEDFDEDFSGEEAEDETESEAPLDEALPATNSQAGVVLVDHTPQIEEPTPRKLKGDASLAVLAPSEDGTVVSIINDDDDVDTIDPHGERVSYGPVVNTIPAALRMQPIGAPSTAPSVTFSLAVEARSVASLDDEMDETFCGDTTIGETAGEQGWGDDQTLEDLDADASINRPTTQQAQRSQGRKEAESSQPEVMVCDHMPQINTPRPRMGDASLVALAPSEADTYRSANDIDDDTIVTQDIWYGKVLDHTPRLPPVPLVTSNSMAVAASADLRSEMEREDDLDATLGGDTVDALAQQDGWGEDEEALEDIQDQMPATVEQAEETLVDHTPVADAQPKPALADPSVAVLAPSDDGSREEDNDTYGDRILFGNVVDITPELPAASAAMSESVVARHDGELEGTLYGDSTVGGENGWDDDEAGLEDLADDEVKEEEESVAANPVNQNSWQAAELISDNASSHGKSFQDVSSSQDGGVVLVDHTPSEIIDTSAQKNSVAWLVNVESGISGDETEDAGATSSSWRENQEAAGPAPAAEEDQVVDRIPHGAASRYGDASTLVVADPSEVLSHVGDMLQEEGEFGPIVDLTPPQRPSGPNVISAAGSTIVVAPTVVPDDLDDADPDDTVNAGEGDGWEQDPSEIEQAPNPQSGNEDETSARVREQVVDFLPPPQRDNPPDQNRDGWSEVATGGAPSVLAADPRETDFGPVVDQLPILHPSTEFSALSTASQLASCDAGEDETETEDGSKQEGTSGVVVDPLPSTVALQNLDSTASLAHSLASEDEDDDGKYGPVVDHLPSIRSSLPPSRGGSTVDALATVSEVIDDDDDDEENASSEGGGAGWGDDDLGEIDLSERNEDKETGSDGQTPADGETKERSDDQNQGDRGMTVRFQSVVAAIFESSSNNEIHQSNSTTSAEDRASKPTTSVLGGPIFHDEEASEPAEPNAWDDDIDFDVTFNTRLSGNDRTMMMSPERLTQFSEADTPPATPYSRSKTTHRDANEMPPVGVALPDLGAAATTKLTMECSTCADATTNDCPCVQRILRRKEDGDDSINVDYNKLLQSEITKRRLVEEGARDLRAQLETLRNSKSAGEVRMETVRTLQEHVKVVESRLQDAGKLSDELREQNKKLQSSLSDAQATLSSLEGQRELWVARAEKTEKEMRESLSAAKKGQEQNEKLLREEIESKKEDLSRQLKTSEAESTRLRTENVALASDLATFRKSLEDKEGQIADLLKSESELEAQLQESKDLILEFEMANESARELQDLYKDVTELCEKLKNDVTVLEKQAQAAETEKVAAAEERDGLARQHQTEIAGLTSQLDRLRQQLDESKELRNQEGKDRSIKLQQLQLEYEKVANEKQTLEAQVREAQTSGGVALREAQTELDAKRQELQGANEQLSFLSEQNAELEEGLVEVALLSEKLALLESDMQVVQDEREALRIDLRDANATVSRLQQQIENQGIEEGAMEQKKNLEIEALATERSQLQIEINGKSRQIEALEQQSALFAQERETLTSECANLKEMAESSRVEASDANEHLAKLLDEFEALQNEIAELTEEKAAFEAERDAIWQKSSELEASLASAQQDASQDAERAKEMDQLMARKHEEVTKLVADYGSVATERDQLQNRCNELETLLSEKTQDSHEVSRLLHDNTALFEQVRAVQQELENQNMVLQDFEARTAALDKELSVERQTSANKDEAIMRLQEELATTRHSLEMSTEGASKLPERINQLEAERNNLEHHAQELLERNEALTEDRNRAASECESYAQENEEMLVQFGLLNEQLDSFREQTNELQNMLQSYEQATTVNDQRILDLQQQLVTAENAQRATSERNAGLVEEKNSELMELRNEQIKLIEEIQVLNALSAEKDDVIVSLTNDLEGLKSEMFGYEELKSDSALITSHNEELSLQVKDLELQRHQLEANGNIQQDAISGLMNELSDLRTAASLSEERVKVLEEACSGREAALQQKEGEIRELVSRLHHASGSSVESTEEILELRSRLNQMETTNQETMDRMHQVAAERDGSQEELASTREHLAAAQASVEQMEQKLADKEAEALKVSEDQEAYVTDLENKLMEKRREVAELTQRSSTLGNEVETLRVELETSQSQPPAPAIDEAAVAETESLKELVKSLKEELETSKCNASTREDGLQEEISSLKRRIATKDGEALMLKNKVESLRGEVQSSREQVEGKVAELQQLASEIDSMRQVQEAMPENTQISAAQLLEATKENAENPECLRATVISLASALETSENLRADAIDRLMSERDTYAKNLRHFSDSVKRFYHVLSFNDT